MKRYELEAISHPWHDSYEMAETDDGDYVLHSDALAAIETARKEERERIVREAATWIEFDGAMSSIALGRAARWLEYSVSLGPTTPTGDENG